MSAETPSLPPLAWEDAVIEEIVPLTPHIKSFFFRAPLAPHKAGQHVDLKLTAPDGYTAERSYSIASAPGAPLIELAIERLDDGEVSSFFHEVAEPGDTIALRGPIGGHFVWEKTLGGPLLLVAGGSGIAPLIAMLRHRAQASPEVPALLLYSGRTIEEMAYLPELLEMEKSDANFQLVLAITRGERLRPDDLQMRFDQMAVTDSLTAWGFQPRITYVCGSNGFVGAMANALVGHGVAPEGIRTERFGGAP
ncbi:FAD-binding oxidoreductase [Methyloligella sp. 2.7D]|uniref:FAD-binding oxidoreductase n=1 Tax=unclassified Methyloligella TaxID=2625955 RepID=UPI00157C52DF|nr:FAD-binding oxidoreductase [Methyloligella sp. GL2]QKP76206.1 oxidoreductase [Methyloligella sp. GL2]